MPKDALTIYRAACELDMLVGGRIDKVTMPNADTVILLIHTAAGNHRLLLSCNPSLPRAHITTMQYKNPETASGTLMYFRKRLTGAVLTAVVKDRCERIISFELSALDELRERVKYSLKVELTGKCANIVFVGGDGTIGNCLRRITAEVDGKRAVFPGLAYTLPNPTGRVGIFDRESLKSRVAAMSGVSFRAALNKCVAGLAVTTVDELVSRMNVGDETPPSDALTDAFIALAEKLYTAPASPVVSFDGNKPLDYFVEPYSTCGGAVKRYPSLNAAMDDYYSSLFAASDLTMRLKPLRAAVKTATAKNRKRREDALVKLAESEAADTDRQLGELITANIYKIKRGDSSVTVQNWFTDGSDVTIPLDVTKNAQQNAAAHFKSYSKKKKAAVYARDALQKATDALFTLESISAELDLITDAAEVDEVREELVSLGLIKPDKKRKITKPIPSTHYTFDIYGATLFVGKNHAQNDRITRGAAKTDTWLHVKDAHGSHAVLKTANPTDEQITRAAELAAYYSQSRGSENVAVDYTLIKYVFPHGGGHVEYKNHKTVFVDPKP
ncbi:MAG: NFACT family protein [Clostridia bacterium]|nr:NFACT family protein [Clostridia bacterium]